MSGAGRGNSGGGVSGLGSDPYRDWLRQTLTPEMGERRADQLVQAAVIRRNWPAMQRFGPREVVAVLQDMYGHMREDLGDARADKWLESATQSLSLFMQTAPAPVKPEPIEPVRAPVRWGRRAHDLPLLLARVHNEMPSGRSTPSGRRPNWAGWNAPPSGTCRPPTPSCAAGRPRTA